MGLRETINKSKPAAIAVTSALVVAAVGLTVWSNRKPERLTSAFFTTDNGATYFADDINKAAPFDHDGKQAVRAYVYNIDNKPTVAYMERYTAEARPAAEAILRKQDGSIQAQAELTNFLQKGNPLEVKRPIDAKWVSGNSKEAAQIRSSAGGGAPAVYP